MAKLSEYELEREANIARNRALLAELEIKEAVAGLGVPAKFQTLAKSKAKPIQPTKRVKREKEVLPRRQSARLRPKVEPVLNGSLARKRKREEEEAKEAEEELEREAAERLLKRPRHHDLDLITLAAGSAEESSSLVAMLKKIPPAPKRIAQTDAFVFDGDDKATEDQAAVNDLREKLQGLKIAARAKVTENRIYSAAYHPDATKDLIFFGDKHGQLGIWDALASSEEVSENEDSTARNPGQEQEGGKYWRLQLHWPATPKSSISCIKLDTIDSHTVFTSAYDCTVRSLSFETGVSREIFSTESALISSIDLVPTGHEMWISDVLGGLTHLDLREDKSKARWFELAGIKIGCVSINPTNPLFLLTASNDKMLKIWDSRKLGEIANRNSLQDCDTEVVSEFLESEAGKGTLRGEWRHNQAVTAAYWDPRGRGIVSTCYDDNLRLWDVGPSMLVPDTLPSFRPISSISHNCQTGRWLTLLKAQWSQNPDVYPHFTIGNMKHTIDIYSCKGDLVTRLADPQRISAVQAVTCSHPNIVERAASGNATGRCVIWAPPE